MTEFKKLFKQYWQLGLVAIAAIVLLTIVSAMSGDPRQVGSSYSSAPNGYHAWYQMIVDRGIKINRWQKSFAQLANYPDYRYRTTLLQVQPQLERFLITNQQQEWIEQGNTLVLLGTIAPAEDIPFKTNIESPQGKIIIETTRRFRADIRNNKFIENAAQEVILADRFGDIMIQFSLGNGRIIIATTPYLAANAYQDFKPNYDLLAELVTKDRREILVDEYIHGYIDRAKKSTVNSREEADAFSYLAGTPLMIVFLNLVLGILVLVWQQNRRFGKVFIPKSTEVENSEAYIQALGGVLRQANSSEFVIQNIGKVEQLSWQQQLGLGKERLVEPQILITAWENQTKLPTEDLRFVLQLMSEAGRISPENLTLWLKKIREIGQVISNK
jgi:Domain of unknown function (DUF4350)